MALRTSTDTVAFANIICIYTKYNYQLQEKKSNYLSLFGIQYLYRYNLAKSYKYFYRIAVFALASLIKIRSTEKREREMR